MSETDSPVAESPRISTSNGRDLIKLQNQRNGETYRFACKTCIDGHRAPQCDPKKHRGRVVFRRPNPGRPAKQCGHTRSAQCDCMAQRTLCCNPTSQQWDQVIHGEIPSITMYDGIEALEYAESGAANFELIESPTLSPCCPSDTSVPLSDQHPDLPPSLRNLPKARVFGLPIMSLSATHSAAVHTAQQSQIAHGIVNITPDIGISPSSLHIDPQNQLQPVLHTHFDQAAFITYSPINSIPSTLMSDSLQAQIPAIQPSQSCCSQRSRPLTTPPQTFDTFMFPNAAPMQQFPCPNCASTLCTCLNCPSTMQSFDLGGAWAQACGRSGHLENEFPPKYSPINVDQSNAFGGPSRQGSPQQLSVDSPAEEHLDWTNHEIGTDMILDEAPTEHEH